MKLALERNSLAKILLVLLVVALAFGIGFGAAGAANAAVVPLGEDLLVAQITDLHYFPYAECYSQENEDYSSSEFYSATKTDTKLVLESGTLLNQVILNFIALSPENTPDILLVAGDLTKNAEMTALIDVANALRYLQNEMRKKKAGFQILLVPGNHDLYNRSAKTYDSKTGEGYGTYTADIETFKKIFAGLGYPDLTDTDEIAYAQNFWRSEYVGYHESKNSANIKYTYYDKAAYPSNNSKNNNELSYVAEVFTDNTLTTSTGYTFVMMDATDRNIDTTGETAIKIMLDCDDPSNIPSDAAIAAYNALNGTAYTKSDLFIMTGMNTYKKVSAATTAELAAARPNPAAASDEERYKKGYFVKSSYSHITGGRITQPALEWIIANTDGARLRDDTIILTSHFNFLPQWGMEPEIFKDFTHYNWEYTVRELLKNNMRYAFTGHMHATDIQNYIDLDGNVFWSFESGSLVSLNSPVRYTKFSRYREEGAADSLTLENVDTWITTINNLQKTQGLHIDTPKEYNPSDADWGSYKDWFVVKDIKNIDNLSVYIGEEIYDILIDRFLSGFLSEEFLNELLGMTDSLIDMIDGLIPNAGLGDLVKPVLDFAIDTLLNAKVYGEGGNVISFLNLLVRELVEYPVYTDPSSGNVWTFEKTALNVYKMHLSGTDLRSLKAAENSEYGRAVLATINLLDNGTLVKHILYTVLNPLLLDEGSLLKELLHTKTDLTLTMSKNDATTLTTILKSLLGATVDLKDFSLNDLIYEILPTLQKMFLDDLGFSLPQGMTEIDKILEDFLSKYMTESFFTGLGGLLSEIVYNFAIDPTEDSNHIDFSRTNPYRLKYKTSDTYTFAGARPDDFKASFIQIGRTRSDPELFTATGQVPSFIAAHNDFADSGTYYVQFLTSYEMQSEAGNINSAGASLEYRKKGEASWTAAAIDWEYAALPYPLIDLGLFATTTKTSYGDEKTPLSIVTDDIKQDYGEILKNIDKVENDSVFIVKKYFVTLTGLDPDTVYEYRLAGLYNKGSGDIKRFPVMDGENEYIFSLRTFPDADAPSESFNVFAFTDIQGMLYSNYIDSAEVYSAIQNSSYTDLKDVRFILNAGDLVDSGKNIKQWNYLFNSLYKMTGSNAMYVAAGNHEDGDNALNNYYSYNLQATQNTDTGMYYSFKYHNAKFIVLNTNDSAGLVSSKADSQLSWLKNELSQANALRNEGKIDWVVVMMHKGLFTAGSHSFDGEVVQMRNILTKLFFDNGVNLVLQGHDHTFTTTQYLDQLGNEITVRPTDANGFVENPHGVLYVTMGTLGDKYYEFLENPNVTPVINGEKSILHTLDKPTFLSLSFAGNLLTVSSYYYDFETKLIQSIGASKIKLDSSGTNVTNSTQLKSLSIGENQISTAGGTVTQITKEQNLAPHNVKFVPAEGNYAYKYALYIMKGASYAEVVDRSQSFAIGDNPMKFVLYPEKEGSGAVSPLEIEFTIYLKNYNFFSEEANAEQKFLDSIKIGGKKPADNKVKISFFAGKGSLKLTYDEKYLAKGAKGTAFNKVELITDGIGMSKDGKVIVRVYAEDGTTYDVEVATERENYALFIGIFAGAAALILIVLIAIIAKKSKKKKAAAYGGRKPTDYDSFDDDDTYYDDPDDPDCGRTFSCG